LELRKNILDFRKSEHFFEEAIKRDYSATPILSTGGYNDRFLTFVSHVFQSQVVKCRGDFLHFVVRALDYLNKHTNDCFFITHGNSRDKITDRGKLSDSAQTGSQVKQHFFSLKDELYPYLIVNVRSGASFTRVDSPDQFERVCGSSIGSSFFWGILRLLNYYNDPTEAVYAAAKGDSSRIDMSVGDIYGGSYTGIGLAENYIASSFGKLKDLNGPEELRSVMKEDVARSLLTMTAVNLLIFSNVVA
jgi:pantothenate kinase